MKISQILIPFQTEKKIFQKHNVVKKEINDVLKNDAPGFKKVGGNQYLAIGISKIRYLTIFFRYDHISKQAEITTAYPSPKNHVRSYKRMKK